MKLTITNFLVLFLVVAGISPIFSQTWSVNGSNIYYNSGNVGIGTISPNSSLEVNGDIQLTQNGSQYVKTFGTLRLSADHNGQGAGNIEFKTNGGGTKMIILNNGKVGIGTTDVGAFRFAVNGKIHVREVKVDLTGWPDYVFKENYTLPTLEEVEKHIKEKGHLINLPSAKEVEANGVELGEMNKLLLEKIEELTLYVIELKHENERLKNLEKRIKQIERKLKHND